MLLLLRRICIAERKTRRAAILPLISVQAHSNSMLFALASALLQGQYSCSRPYPAACLSSWLSWLQSQLINCRSSSSRRLRHSVQPAEMATHYPTSSGRGGRHSGCRAMTTSVIARGSGAPRGWRELPLRWCRGTRRMAGECGDETWDAAPTCKLSAVADAANALLPCSHNMDVASLQSNPARPGSLARSKSDKHAALTPTGWDHATSH